MSNKGNELIINKHVLLCLEDKKNPEFEELKNKFCGIVTQEIKDLSKDQLLYLYGDMKKIYDKIKDLNCKIIYVIKELSSNYEVCEKYKIINIGMVPININNIGIYFRNFFEQENIFDLIKEAHNFKKLKQGSKIEDAFRKGIYLSKVVEEKDGLKYNLLRCSTNIDGGTQNLKDIDNQIISQINNICQDFFTEKVELNHALVQLYESNGNKKARIKHHSDKTKDMPENGVIVFGSFYDLKGATKSKTDMFDYCYKKTSVLTSLQFVLKSGIKDEKLVEKFSIKLYPNSVFIIPLSTNRLYTHATEPSILQADKISLRIGYTIRCSKTLAKYMNGTTYIIKDDKYIKLEDMTKENEKELTDMYYSENTTDKVINYGDIYYSMNRGDYMKPEV
jgi:hypothetical protein